MELNVNKGKVICISNKKNGNLIISQKCIVIDEEQVKFVEAMESFGIIRDQRFKNHIKTHKNYVLQRNYSACFVIVVNDMEFRIPKLLLLLMVYCHKIYKIFEP